MSDFEERVNAEMQKRLSDPMWLRERLLRALNENINLVNAVQNLKQELKELIPAKDFYKVAAESEDWMEMAVVVKVLAYRGYGRNKTFKLLRNCQILRKNNEPYQQYVERGYFRTVEAVYEYSIGRTVIYRKTMVSQRGLDFIRKLIRAAA